MYSIPTLLAFEVSLSSGWIALKLGLSFTTALMLFFSIGMIGLISLRRKRIKE